MNACFRTGSNGPRFRPKVRLQKGERIRILPLDHPRPLLVKFQRFTPDDPGHHLWMRTARTVPGQTEDDGYFSELFKFVERVA